MKPKKINRKPSVKVDWKKIKISDLNTPQQQRVFTAYFKRNFA